MGIRERRCSVKMNFGNLAITGFWKSSLYVQYVHIQNWYILNIQYTCYVSQTDITYRYLLRSHTLYCYSDI